MILRPMLAGRADHLEQIRLPCLATPKIDGIRCLRIGQSALSRSFKPIRNKHIVSCLETLPEGLDGELVAGTFDFQGTTSAVMSYEGKPDFRYWVFDWYSDEPYEKRCEKVVTLNSPYVLPVLPTLIATHEKLAEFDASCLSQGFEGIMTRSPGSPYKFGRSNLQEQWLLKHKKYCDSEAIIIGFDEQMQNCNPVELNVFGYTRRPGGRSGHMPKGTLGSLLVRDLYTGIEFSVGSGMDDSLRATIWDNQAAYLGKIITYRCQTVGVKDKPRFPRFMRFRHAEDIQNEAALG